MQDAVREATSTWLERLLAFMHHIYPGLLLEGQFGMLVDQCYESLPPASGTLELAFALLQVHCPPAALPELLLHACIMGISAS